MNPVYNLKNVLLDRPRTKLMWIDHQQCSDRKKQIMVITITVRLSKRTCGNKLKMGSF